MLTYLPLNNMTHLYTSEIVLMNNKMNFICSSFESRRSTSYSSWILKFNKQQNIKLMMCRTLTLIIEFKLLNRMENIYRLYPLIHYGDFCRFWINISKKYWYIEIFDIDGTIRYDISISKRYINIFNISTHLYYLSNGINIPVKFQPTSTDPQ